MSQTPAIVEISQAAKKLSPEQQQRVLDYIRTIASKPIGNRPADILQFAGSIPLADCIEMEKAIDEGCEQIDSNGW